MTVRRATAHAVRLEPGLAWVFSTKRAYAKNRSGAGECGLRIGVDRCERDSRVLALPGDRLPGEQRRSMSKATAPIPGPCGQLQCTAYHEAGHAEMAVSSEDRFHWVSIRPKGDRLGFVNSLHDIDPDDPFEGVDENEEWGQQFLTLRTRTFVAGPMAEAVRLAQRDGLRVSLRRVLQLYETTSEGQADLRSAQKIAFGLFGEVAGRRWLADAERSVAERYLEDPVAWACVEALAVSLVAHEEFLGDIAVWIVSQARSGMNFLAFKGELASRVTGSLTEVMARYFRYGISVAEE